MLIRTILYLDESLLTRLRHVVPVQDLNQLVDDLLSERLARLELAEFAAQMCEDYLAARRDREELNAAWQAVDGEVWPE